MFIVAMHLMVGGSHGMVELFLVERPFDLDATDKVAMTVCFFVFVFGGVIFLYFGFEEFTLLVGKMPFLSKRVSWTVKQLKLALITCKCCIVQCNPFQTKSPPENN
eukprot:TRINITY_DN6164_c0_g1_i4.p1 TRINITY_DN6164_c0_g1~~TRINITY_DN6164_c0_g1_i4.p1  ORF type:complete len:106 (+),score=14.73 TRINITY_DN6164_c0_g1_i4:113-430(+)